jgi:hypothetical protein
MGPRSLDLRLCRFIPGKRAPSTHWIESWVGLKAGPGGMEKGTFLILPGLQPRPLCRPARSRSLYRLYYRGSYKFYNIFADAMIAKLMFPTTLMINGLQNTRRQILSIRWDLQIMWGQWLKSWVKGHCCCWFLWEDPRQRLFPRSVRSGNQTEQCKLFNEGPTCF